MMFTVYFQCKVLNVITLLTQWVPNTAGRFLLLMKLCDWEQLWTAGDKYFVPTQNGLFVLSCISYIWPDVYIRIGNIYLNVDFSINGQCSENLLRSQRTPTLYKIKVNWFSDKNRVNSSNFNATILKLSEKFDHSFSHVFIFGNVFLESYGLVTMPVTSCIEDTCSNLSESN